MLLSASGGVEQRPGRSGGDIAGGTGRELAVPIDQRFDEISGVVAPGPGEGRGSRVSHGDLSPVTVPVGAS